MSRLFLSLLLLLFSAIPALADGSHRFPRLHAFFARLTHHRPQTCIPDAQVCPSCPLPMPRRKLLD